MQLNKSNKNKTDEIKLKFKNKVAKMKHFIV